MPGRSFGQLVLVVHVATILSAQTQLDRWSIEHFQQAIQAQKSSQFDKAVDEYRLVLSRNPKFAEAYLNLGIVYHLQSRFPDSIKALSQALAIQPEMLAAQVLLGVGYYQIQDFTSAQKFLDRALLQNPKERQAGIYRALALVGSDRPDDAAHQLRQTAQYFPDDFEILYHLGAVYSEGVKRNAQFLWSSSRESALYEWAMALAMERKGDLNSAIEKYLTSLQLDPNISQIYSRLAILFEKAGLPEMGKDAASRLTLSIPPSNVNQTSLKGEPATDDHHLSELWQKLGPIRPDPNLPRIADTYINKLVKENIAADTTGTLRSAVALFEKGDFQAAKTLITRTRRQGPTQWVYAYLLVRCHVGDGDFDSAEKAAESSLRNQSQIPSVALLKLEIQSELAFRAYDALLSMQPDSNPARILRAKALAAASNTDQAIEEFREILKIQPDLPQVHLGIAQVYCDQLKWEEAIQELKAELELAPENGLALALLGHAYAESDQADEAIPVLSKVLARYPREASALADLGKAYAQQGNTSKAIDAFERALQYDRSRYRIHYRLFWLYRSAGRTELARQHLAEFQGEAAKRGVKPKTAE